MEQILWYMWKINIVCGFIEFLTPQMQYKMWMNIPICTYKSKYFWDNVLCLVFVVQKMYTCLKHVAKFEVNDF